MKINEKISKKNTVWDFWIILIYVIGSYEHLWILI